MVFAWRKLFGARDKAVQPDTWSRMQGWDYCEAEGVSAALNGKTQDDNPYDQETQKDEWNFWFYGFSNVEGERRMIETGTYSLCSTSSHMPVLSQSLEEAYRQGRWKPRYVKAPSSWGEHASEMKGSTQWL